MARLEMGVEAAALALALLARRSLSMGHTAAATSRLPTAAAMRREEASRRVSLPLALLLPGAAAAPAPARPSASAAALCHATASSYSCLKNTAALAVPRDSAMPSPRTCSRAPAGPLPPLPSSRLPCSVPM